MVITFASAAMSFENGVRNLTIHVGSGNPGVNALGFEANNQGGIQNVTINQLFALIFPPLTIILSKMLCLNLN
jgi:hypothetical protein